MSDYVIAYIENGPGRRGVYENEDSHHAAINHVVAAGAKAGWHAEEQRERARRIVGAALGMWKQGEHILEVPVAEDGRPLGTLILVNARLKGRVEATIRAEMEGRSKAASETGDYEFTNGPDAGKKPKVGNFNHKTDTNMEYTAAEKQSFIRNIADNPHLLPVSTDRASAVIVGDGADRRAAVRIDGGELPLSSAVDRGVLTGDELAALSRRVDDRAIQLRDREMAVIKNHIIETPELFASVVRLVADQLETESPGVRAHFAHRSTEADIIAACGGRDEVAYKTSNGLNPTLRERLALAESTVPLDPRQAMSLACDRDNGVRQTLAGNLVALRDAPDAVARLADDQQKAVREALAPTFEVAEAMISRGGSFVAKLGKAHFAADEGNAAAIETGFRALFARYRCEVAKQKINAVREESPDYEFKNGPDASKNAGESKGRAR